MSRLLKNSSLFFIVVMGVAVSLGFVSVAHADDAAAIGRPQLVLPLKMASVEEMIATAKPYPLPTIDASLGEESTEFTAAPLGEPGFVNGTLPVGYGGSSTESEAAWVGDEPQWGGPPGNWQTSYPGPFQRWTWFGAYLTFPTSTIGKLFFYQDADGNGSYESYVCSASVIYGGGPQHDVIATAGHCINNGLNGAGYNGGWSFNLYFCPSYNKNGVNPARGYWQDAYTSTLNGWYWNSNSEYDIGCMVARNTGSVYANHVGNVTGTLGRAWDWGTQQPEFSFGYPAASPFPGYHIIAVAGPEWYTYSWGTGPDCKYMGNDMTGGCSGGPWIIGWGHKTYEYPDTDGSNATDPAPMGQGYINGVNSHKIVVNGVTRTQEIGSPQFTGTEGSENLWSYCQSLANSD
jgi:hypothetical protein